MFLKFLIPDVPSSLKYKIRREVSQAFSWLGLKHTDVDVLGIHHERDNNPDRETQDLSQDSIRNPERLPASAHKAELSATPQRDG